MTDSPYNHLTARFQGEQQSKKGWYQMAISKFQNDCTEALKKIEESEGLSRTERLSAALAAAFDAFGGIGRKEKIQDIEEMVHLASAAVGAFNLQHLTGGDFSEKKITFSPEDMALVATLVPLVDEALTNIVYLSLLDQENVPVSPKFFLKAQVASTRLLGAKAASRLGVAGVTDEEKKETCNSVVAGIALNAAHAGASLLVSQYNVGSIALGKPRLDEETSESLLSDFETGFLDVLAANSQKWHPYLAEKLKTSLAAANASGAADGGRK